MIYPVKDINLVSQDKKIIIYLNNIKNLVNDYMFKIKYIESRIEFILQSNEINPNINKYEIATVIEKINLYLEYAFYYLYMNHRLQNFEEHQRLEALKYIEDRKKDLKNCDMYIKESMDATDTLMKNIYHV